MTASGQSKTGIALATLLALAAGQPGCQTAMAPPTSLLSPVNACGNREPAVIRMAAEPTPGGATLAIDFSSEPASPARGILAVAASSEILYTPALVIGGPASAAEQAHLSEAFSEGIAGIQAPVPIPTELQRVSLPPYTIAPPDILFIDTVRLIPRPPYRLEPLEVLLVKVTETLPEQPIEGAFTISPEGTINLGYTYGNVNVAGCSLDQAQAAIRTHLSNLLRDPQVMVALAQFRGIQQTRGEHLIRPDGTVSLGAYGCVYVAGLTVSQAKCEIEKHLSKYFLNPQVAVDVFAYNSKVYYVIFDGGGYGTQVLPFPITGNETVLDAIARVSGLAPVSSVHRIWVARPSPAGHTCDQVLPVDWLAIVKGGSTATNYQLFPGDRVYVDSDCLIKADNWLAKIFAPVERVLGITLLGTTTVQTIRDFNRTATGVIIP